MTRLRKNIDEFLNVARVSITNALNTPEILTKIAIYGYVDTRLQEGLALLDAAEAAYAIQKQEYGEQYAATQNLQDAWAEADKTYTAHRKLAKLA